MYFLVFETTEKKNIITIDKTTLFKNKTQNDHLTDNLTLKFLITDKNDKNPKRNHI